MLKNALHATTQWCWIPQHGLVHAVELSCWLDKVDKVGLEHPASGTRHRLWLSDWLWLWYIIYHISYLVYHISYIMYHASCNMYYVSSIMYLIYFNFCDSCAHILEQRWFGLKWYSDTMSCQEHPNPFLSLHLLCTHCEWSPSLFILRITDTAGPLRVPHYDGQNNVSQLKLKLWLFV